MLSDRIAAIDEMQPQLGSRIGHTGDQVEVAKRLLDERVLGLEQQLDERTGMLLDRVELNSDMLWRMNDRIGDLGDQAAVARHCCQARLGLTAPAWGTRRRAF